MIVLSPALHQGQGNSVHAACGRMLARLDSTQLYTKEASGSLTEAKEPLGKKNVPMWLRRQTPEETTRILDRIYDSTTTLP